MYAWSGSRLGTGQFEDIDATGLSSRMVRKTMIRLLWLCCAGLFLWVLAAPWFPKKVECPYCDRFKAACGSFSVRKDDPIVLVTTDCMRRSKFNPSEPTRYEIVEHSDRLLSMARSKASTPCFGRGRYSRSGFISGKSRPKNSS